MIFFSAFTFIYLEVILQECRDGLAITRAMKKDATPDHDTFFQQIEEQALSFLEGRLQVIEISWDSLSKNPANDIVQGIFKRHYKNMGNELNTKLNELITPLTPSLWTKLELESIKRIQGILLRNFKDEHIDKHKKLFILLNTEMLRQSLSAIKDALSDNHAPTCFISYSWSNATYVRRIRKIALDLKDAGINILLDVKNNKTGQLGPFIGLVNSASKADYILVMCTEDSKEKWETYLKFQHQKIAPSSVPPVHVLPLEFNQIFNRYYKEQHSRQSIFPILISGNNETSLPEFLTTATTHLAQTDCTKYGEQLFKLLKILYQGNNKILAEIDKQEKHYSTLRNKNARLPLDRLKQEYKEFCQTSLSSVITNKLPPSSKKTLASSTESESSNDRSDQSKVALHAQAKQSLEIKRTERRLVACSSSSEASNAKEFINSATGNDLLFEERIEIAETLFEGIRHNLIDINIYFSNLENFYEEHNFEPIYLLSVQPVTVAYEKCLNELAALIADIKSYIKQRGGEYSHELLEGMLGLSDDIKKRIRICKHLAENPSEWNTTSKGKTKNRSTERQKPTSPHAPPQNNTNKQATSLSKQTEARKEVRQLWESIVPRSHKAPWTNIDKYYKLMETLTVNTTYVGRKHPPIEGFEQGRDLRLYDFSASNIKNVVFNGNPLTAANFTNTIGLSSRQLARANYDFLIISCSDPHVDIQNIENTKKACRGYKKREKKQYGRLTNIFSLFRSNAHHQEQRNIQDSRIEAPINQIESVKTNLE
jgi:SEFIR domain